MNKTISLSLLIVLFLAIGIVGCNKKTTKTDINPKPEQEILEKK